MKYSIGIGVNLFDARALLLSEDGKIILDIEKKRKTTSANESIEILIDLFSSILNKSKKYKNDILGVSLALGGIVDNKKGIVYWPQKQNSSYVYISVPLKKYFQERFKLPIIIENDANACAWAEYITNYNKFKNIIYMLSGVGCGLVIDGALYRGRDGAAGELFVTPHKIMSSYLGDYSFLSQWPLDLGVAKRAKELISLGKETSLIKRIAPTGDLKLEDVIEEANKKDRLSKDILKEAAFCLGIKLAFLVNLLNPEIVIIGRGFQETGNFFLEEITRALKNFSFSEDKRNLKIVVSSMGSESSPLGAAHLFFEKNSLQ